MLFAKASLILMAATIPLARNGSLLGQAFFRMNPADHSSSESEAVMSTFEC